MVDTTTPYSSAALLFGTNIPAWLDSYNAARVQSYNLYDDIYWNSPDTFKLLLRGTNDNPVYIPSGRVICNTVNRYVARGLAWDIDEASGGSSAQQQLLKTTIDALFKRERFMSQFNSNKLWGIVRGDAAWYISANPFKDEGRRISIKTVHPGSVFRVEDDNDPDVLLGIRIIEQIVLASDDTKIYVRVQEWLKPISPEHMNYAEDPTTGDPTNYDDYIQYSLTSYELDGWNDPDKAKLQAGADQIAPLLIEGITTLPVYTWKNMEEPENPWGSSEMRGIETLFAGINQAASDEDLALAIAGLGQYVTDAGAPEGGSWGLGPAEVVEIAVGRKFDRINGITSVEPSKTHIELLEDRASRVSGASDVAQGRVDVSVAESGIALELRLGPILDEAAIKDQMILDCMNQMIWDLRQWLEVYEDVDFGTEQDDGGAFLTFTVGPKIPENTSEHINFLFQGLQQTPPLFSQSYVLSELKRLGWAIPATMAADVVAEQEAYQTAVDAYGARLGDEAGAPTDPTTDPNAEA